MLAMWSYCFTAQVLQGKHFVVSKRGAKGNINILQEVVRGNINITLVVVHCTGITTHDYSVYLIMYNHVNVSSALVMVSL